VKTKFFVALLAVMFAVFSPLVLKESKSDDSAENNADESYVYEDENTEYSDWEPVLKVDVLMGDKCVSMDIEKYIVGVVAGEMPASFEEEALMAQAVAARTYTLYKMWVQPSANHDADVCTDPACCKAYADENTLKERWGSDFDKNMGKIKACVWSTQGVYMTYDNEPVLAVFHSSSAGKTENSGDVWNEDVPYLVSVESPESGSMEETEISFDEFKMTFLKNYPDGVFGDDKNAWITDIVYTDSGRIDTLCIGGVTIRGTAFRSIFGLRSTAVDIAITENGFVFTSEGYGHGVGMSQYGANTMAQNGKNWQDILLWYYTGIEFGTLLGTI